MKNIAKAFIEAKKEFAPARKNANNPQFKSKYADLASCIEAVDDSFLSNGIVMYQETFEDNTGVTVETVLLHESGETIRCGKLHVPANKQDAQGYGSALSYARRYSLLAACGIAPEDDDGNAASKPQPAKAVPNADLEPRQLASDKQQWRLNKDIEEAHFTNADAEAFKAEFGVLPTKAGIARLPGDKVTAALKFVEETGRAHEMVGMVQQVMEG